MKINNKSILTSKEEELMNFFWEKGPLFVREILNLYPEPRPHFNTISTIVRGLEDKGFVSHESFGPTYRYFACVTEEQIGTKTFKGIIGKYFGHSPFNAISALVKEEKITAQQLRELLDIVEKGEQK